MGRGWARGRGDTSQERDKLVEVLSTSRIVVIFGGSEDRGYRILQYLWHVKISKHTKNVAALSIINLRVHFICAGVPLHSPCRAVIA